MIAGMPEPNVHRVVLDQEPFLEHQLSEGIWRRYQWPASWIAPSGSLATPILFAARCRFTVEVPSAPIRLHVSADERFELYLDGALVARGPERGDPDNWFFQTYDIADLAPGEHLLVARVWAMGDAAPIAQLSAGPAFLLAAEGAWGERLSTGVAPWQTMRIEGIDIRHHPEFGHDGFTGKKFHIHAERFPFGFETDRADDPRWTPAHTRYGATASYPIERHAMRTLRPAMLPDMMRAPIQRLRVRFAERLAGEVDLPGLPCENGDADLADSIQTWLDGKSPLRIEADTRIRAIIDLDDYYCAYPTLVASGGRGALVELGWAEALYTGRDSHEKGNRDEVDHRFFRGFSDAFSLDGGDNRSFTTPWWQAGRYLQLHVRAAEEPLELLALSLEETRYPLGETRLPSPRDPELARAVQLARRSLEMCLHETFMDCPYYEQLAYIGDTRLQALALMSISEDDRPIRKAIELFDASRLPSGWTYSRYPSRSMQVIPTFSMIWIGMVHDYLRIRGEEAFVRARLPGVRAVIDACLAHVDAVSGLLLNPPGWNFVDWAPGFADGMPQTGVRGPGATINWLFVMALRWWSELEDRAGEPEQHARARRWETTTAAAVDKAFWNEARGAWAETLEPGQFSEHAQALGILAGADREHSERAVKSLANPDPQFVPATIYFSHYVFEALERMGLSDAVDRRLGLWRSLGGLGLRTLPEQPEPTRSDCHAWGAHVLLHLGNR